MKNILILFSLLLLNSCASYDIAILAENHYQIKCPALFGDLEGTAQQICFNKPYQILSISSDLSLPYNPKKVMTFKCYIEEDSESSDN